MWEYSSKPTRIENGKKIFRLDCVIDSVRRGGVAEPSEKKQISETDNATQDEQPVVENNGVVRDRWRLISAVKAWPTTGLPYPQLVDYGHAGGAVLQRAVDIINLSHPDLTWNHSSDAKDVCGHVEAAYWEDSRDIPPGVNADLVVDSNYDKKAAVGLLKEHLRNGSIGFTMDVSPSHEDMEWEEFVERQGEMVDGRQVRWLPSEIYEVRHMALVPAGSGADKFAGKRYGTNNQAVTKKEGEERRRMGNTEFFQQILGQLGVDILLSEDSEVSESTRARVLERIEKLSGVKERYNQLADGLQNFGAKLSEDPLTALDVLARLDGLLDLAQKGEKLVDFKREEALQWFDKAKFSPDKTDLSETEKRIRDRLSQSSDLEWLEDMIAEYKEQAKDKFELNRFSLADELPTIELARDEGNIDIKENARKLFG